MPLPLPPVCGQSLRCGGERGEIVMRAGPASPTRSDSRIHGRARLARAAFRLAEAALIATLSAISVFSAAYAIGGARTTEDNWLGLLVMVAMFTGFLASLAAFVLALAAKIRREPWPLLWLPLSVFPGLLTFMVLGEAFWWE